MIGALDQYLDDVGTRVSRKISPDDHMRPLNGAMTPYLTAGRDALRLATLALMAAHCQEPRRILDFGCGAGRVTRWFRAAYPQAHIAGTELRARSLTFVGDEFDVQPIASTPTITDLELGDPYDLIWVGSVVTHISECDARTLVNKLFSALQPDGVLVFTTHGRRVVQNQLLGRHDYIEPARFATLITQAFSGGYGHEPHVDGRYSGISLTDPSWVVRWCAENKERRLIAITEKGWAKHQDVAVVARQPI